MQTPLESNSLKVLINNFGAEICSIKNNDGLEFIWQANKDVWARHAPVLFPIVGKLKDDFFIFEGNKYELPQHGFARDMVFEIIQNDSGSCTFQLKSSAETKQKFPFDFIFQINYQLVENKLITGYKVVNPSAKPLFFSLGAHPGFNCPLLPNETFEDYYLEFEKNGFVKTHLTNGLLLDTKAKSEFDNNQLHLKKELFDKDALVFENNQINSISLCSSKSNHKITLECEDWPYFGIWSKKNNQNFICLEPWYGITDKANSFNEIEKKEGVIVLAPDDTFSCEFFLIFN